MTTTLKRIDPGEANSVSIPYKPLTTATNAESIVMKSIYFLSTLNLTAHPVRSTCGENSLRGDLEWNGRLARFDSEEDGRDARSTLRLTAKFLRHDSQSAL
jgi:hypothetical protein